jgi:hypothetical protein
MPWHCPACRTTVTHNHAEDRPRPNAIYRCYVCRLELQWNEQTKLLDVLPLPQVEGGDEDIPRL